MEIHAEKAKLSDDAVQQLKMAVDEACANVIEHAYSGSSDHPIDIAVIVKPDRFTVRFGAETDTDDIEGTATATSRLRPARADIEAALKQFVGEIEQVPPRFSALKVDGARAYGVR